MKSNCKPWNVQRQRTIVKIPTKKTVIYYYSLCLKTSGYDSNKLLAHFVERKIHFAVSNHPFMSAFSFFLLFTPNHSDTMRCTVVLFMPVGIEMKWKKIFRFVVSMWSTFCIAILFGWYRYHCQHICAYTFVFDSEESRETMKLWNVTFRFRWLLFA